MSIVRPGTYNKPTREPVQTDPQHPELAFLEEKSQSAFDSKCDTLWLENNADFNLCDRHKQVCEMVKLHPEAHYNPDCQKCLKPAHGGLKDMFFLREGDDLSLSEAQTAWLAFHDKKVQIYRQMSENPAPGNREVVKQFDQRERAAWIRYSFLAWQRNRHRVKVMREMDDAGGMESPGFAMLPPEADRPLSDYVRDASIRNMQTNAGRQGKGCNSKPCDVHSDSGNERVGHAIQVYNKHRYLSCGICFIPRQQTQMQRDMDAYNDSVQAGERPSFTFVKSASASSSSSSSGR
jgi:uncharacterized protein YecT (DUF1311 family)